MSTSTSDKRARPFFCGNWKLFGTIAESVSLATGVADATAGVAEADVAVAPGFVALATVAERLSGSRLGVAAQDCYWEAKGAFTGEVGGPADRRRRRPLRDRRPLGAPPVLRRDRRDGGAQDPGGPAGRPDPHRLHRRDPGRTGRRQDARTGGKPVRRGAGRAWTRRSWPAWSSPTSRSGPSAPGATPPPPRRSRCIASSAGGWQERLERRGRGPWGTYPLRRQRQAGQRRRPDDRRRTSTGPWSAGRR